MSSPTIAPAYRIEERRTPECTEIAVTEIAATSHDGTPIAFAVGLACGWVVAPDISLRRVAFGDRDVDLLKGLRTDSQADARRWVELLAALYVKAARA